MSQEIRGKRDELKALEAQRDALVKQLLEKKKALRDIDIAIAKAEKEKEDLIEAL